MAVPINAAHLEFRLSGGAANTDPNASLGGIMSSEKIIAQSATGISNVTGVTVLFASGNTEGTGTLNFVAASNSFQWTPPGGAAGALTPITEDGRIALFGDLGFGELDLDVDFSSLSGSNEADTLTIANVTNEVFDGVAKADSFAGDIEYRCYYAINVHPTETMLDVRQFVGQQPSPGTVRFGVDPAGVGDGVSTGVATTVVDEDTAPAGVTFSNASTGISGQSLGALGPGEAGAVWVERTIPFRNTQANAETVFLVDSDIYL